MFSSLLPSLLLLAGTLYSGAGEPLPAEAVAPAPGVGDPIFAYLVGLVDADLYGTIDARFLAGVVESSGEDSGLPYRSLRSLTRVKGGLPFSNRLHAIFEEDLDLPIPYSILGYTPGSLRGSRTLSFREYPIGDFTFRYREDSERRQATFNDVLIFGIEDGRLRIDIDGWVDFIAGGKLDDTRVTGLALFSYQGERWGMALGYNKNWKGRSGALNLRENSIRFPSPRAMRSAAWKLRQILESYEPALRPDSLSTNGGW